MSVPRIELRFYDKRLCVAKRSAEAADAPGRYQNGQMQLEYNARRIEFVNKTLSSHMTEIFMYSCDLYLLFLATRFVQLNILLFADLRSAMT